MKLTKVMRTTIPSLVNAESLLDFRTLEMQENSLLGVNFPNFLGGAWPQT